MVEDFADIQTVVDSFLKTPEKELTADQKKIKELEDKINDLTSTPKELKTPKIANVKYATPKE